MRGSGGGGNGEEDESSLAHIPFRNSTLTTVLRNSLGGNCRTAFIVTLNPEAEFVDESISSCRFAGRCAALRHRVKKNRHLDPRAQLRVCQRENELLRETVARQAAELVAARQAATSASAASVATRSRGAAVPHARGGGVWSSGASVPDRGLGSGELHLTAQQRRACEERVIAYLTRADATVPPAVASLPMARGMMALLRHHALHAARMAAAEKRTVARLEAEVQRLRAAGAP